MLQEEFEVTRLGRLSVVEGEIRKYSVSFGISINKPWQVKRDMKLEDAQKKKCVKFLSETNCISI